MPSLLALPIDRIRELLSPTYTIDRELGRGGMATVYLAQDAKHERVVALKVLHPELAASLGSERFLREIKVAARLNHPHILPLFDSGEAQGILYYVMPYVEGETLRERLDRQHQLPIDDSLHLARAIASALDYAHRQNVVHRDVKPENIMLYEGEPMVMDFGIAKAASAAGSDTLTQTGIVVGTPAYVSPEQASGETKIDGRSDQYSLACVLYEMLAGERPFTGPTAQAVLAKRFNEVPRPIGELRGSVPPRVETALGKAMATDPTERFSSVALFAHALDSQAADTITIPQPTVSAAKSVAVLPFADMSAESNNEYFTDGMAEEIINALTKIQSLRVASRTSAFAFKGRNEDIRDIGRKLKVSTVLEGSVRKMGNKLRITAQLVNVADGYHLWSERYDRELEDVFAIQDDISQAIVKSLRVILHEDEQRAIEKSRTHNVQAYDFYLRGRQFFPQFSRKALEYAKQMFNKAIDLDPKYARAYAGVADCYSLLYTYFDAREFNIRQADIFSRKALELEPELAEAHAARGLATTLSLRYEEAGHEFETAMKLDPKLFEAPYFYARAKRQQGKSEDALKLFERASQLRPEDFQAPFFAGDAYATLGMPAEAVATRRRALRLVDERLEFNPDDSRALNIGANILAKLGEKDRAIDYMRRSVAIDPEDPLLLYNAACTFAMLGETEEALSTLERSVEKGYADKQWIERDNDLDPIRETARFKAIAQGM
ncbi:MAG TPA: protein kinase [Gemmatimonadaceae bacterium]|nr:protein kinase [Gemmatimonadaceae bacterium]